VGWAVSLHHTAAGAVPCPMQPLHSIEWEVTHGSGCRLSFGRVSDMHKEADVGHVSGFCLTFGAMSHVGMADALCHHDRASGWQSAARSCLFHCCALAPYSVFPAAYLQISRHPLCFMTVRPADQQSIADDALTATS
jgi:hypothetical protein